MAITAGNSGDAYAGSVAVTGGVSAGSCVVVCGTGGSTITGCAKSAGTATIGDVTALTERVHGTNGFIHTYYCFVTGAGTLTMALTGGGDVGITVHELKGVDSADPLEDEDYAIAAPGIAQNPHAHVTTTIADSVLVACLSDEGCEAGTPSGGSTPGAWTLIGNQVSHQHATEILILSATISDLDVCEMHTTGTPRNDTGVFQVVAFNGIAAGGGETAAQKLCRIASGMQQMFMTFKRSSD